MKAGQVDRAIRWGAGRGVGEIAEGERPARDARFLRAPDRERSPAKFVLERYGRGA